MSLVTTQLKKASEKASDDNEQRKIQNDKKYQNQIDLLKETMRSKSDTYEETIKKVKEELRVVKEKNTELTKKLQSFEHEVK